MDLISKNLDYNLYSNVDRANQVSNLFSENNGSAANNYEANYDSPSVQADLEKIANFILYGKDPKTDKNFCQTKEIQIEQAHSAYQRKKAESLDALLEDPLTNETQFKPVQRNCYKKVKPTISRNPDGPDAKIPGMRDLWDIIDPLAAKVKELKEKQELGLEFYKKNHLLIQLRQEQFALKDAYVEPLRAKFSFSSTVPFVYTSDTGYVKDFYTDWCYKSWRADHYRKHFGETWYANEQEELAEQLRNGIDGWEWVEVSKNYIDFTNPTHVYWFLEFYGELKQLTYEQLNSDLKYLIWELEDYIDQADLSEARRYILIRKIDKTTNEYIREELQEKFGLNYSDNYISTIYTKMICGQIAKTAQLARDAWEARNDPSKFKVCSTCGKTLLRDIRNFTQKQNSRDGLAARCKICDREKRKEKKAKEGTK